MFIRLVFFVRRSQPFSSFLTLLILSQLQPGSFLRLAASESDDLRLQHQSEYFNSLLDKVADYAANPDNAPEWYVNIKSADWKTLKPLQVGSQVTFVAHFLGRKLAYTYEFIELISNQKLVIRTAEGPFPMETTYTWTAIDDQTTKMTLRNKGNPTGFSKLLAPFMATMIEKSKYQRPDQYLEHLYQPRSW